MPFAGVIYLFIYLFVCLFVYLSIYLFIFKKVGSLLARTNQGYHQGFEGHAVSISSAE
jgi:hypothetical protein